MVCEQRNTGHPSGRMFHERAQQRYVSHVGTSAVTQ